MSSYCKMKKRCKSSPNKRITSIIKFCKQSMTNILLSLNQWSDEDLKIKLAAHLMHTRACGLTEI